MQQESSAPDATSPLSSDDEVPSGDDNQQQTGSMASTTSDSFQLSLLTKSWDEVGVLASEIATSVMAKQASILCDRFADRKNATSSDIENTSGRPLKKRKTCTGAGFITTEEDTESSSFPSKPPSVITNDGEEEETTLSDCNSSSTSSAEALVIDDDQFRQVDRLGRMSHLMIQLENCHSQLRAEMLHMAKENGLLYTYR